MKRFIIAAAILVATGCAEKSDEMCSGTINVGGVDQAVKIFGVKDDGRTLVKAGYPFQFHWVSIEQFKSTTCKVAE